MAWAAGLAFTLGAVATVIYAGLGLTLSHYDARGHLVVARRIVDSLTPGWQQIGAVWLPLPHLLNALPVQIDWCYRTGSSGVAISMLAFALAAAVLADVVHKLTSSRLAAVVAAALFAANPNMLYLQATPMTEPLLLGLTASAVAALTRWCLAPSATDDAGRAGTPQRTSTHRVVGWLFALACLTRYEAWPVTASALAAAAYARGVRDRRWRAALLDVAGIAVYPAAAVAAFCAFSRAVVGQWFVSGGFFVPENVALHHPLLALDQIAWGVRAVSGLGVLILGVAGLSAALVVGLTDRRRAALLVPISLAATAALPWVAFLQGHPYRIRYMVPLVAAEAVGAGLVVGLSKRLAPAVALVVLGVAASEVRPFDVAAPMVVEAQWDRPNVARRAPIGARLRTDYQGETVMASMGSLGHYMQELSANGLRLKDFLHEGNGDLWLNALDDPRPYAGWILMDERAEGGDMLSALARERPAFLTGFTRVGEGAGVALYRRTEAPGARSARR